MNKLEQAIRKTADAGFYSSSIFQGDQSNCIEEISKMETSFQISQDDLKKKKIIYPGMKDKKLINSFRELRSSITESNTNTNCIVMVTALSPKSGVSFFARNLASVIAFDSSKTAVLIDCNNVNGEVGDVFDINDSPGITEYISDSSINIENIIYESGIKRLRVVPFGTASSQLDEQYSHPKFSNLLSEIKSKYQDRNIILDAPPILNSADSRILLNYCDQVVIVVPYGKVNKVKLEEAVSLIGREKFSGVVFNDHFN